ncbi:MAG: ATP-binding cassette domain-containing protein [Atopobiaceae bacterium]|nr:ATP-binding cassette domain-containing protein [Atopobiaceae bacterium]
MNPFESQMEARSRLDKKKTQRAYADLAQSVGGKQRSRKAGFFEADDKDAALKACLTRLGIREFPELRMMNQRGTRNRLDALCGSLGVMWRDVNLAPGWQKNAFTPMLGRLDTGELVALLPGKLSGYHVLEPMSGQQRRVTKKVAQHIESDAICFYKPLPTSKLNTRSLLAYMAGVFDVRDYLLVLTASIMATLVGLLPAWANQILFGTVIPSHDVGLVLPIAILLVGVTISRSLVDIVRNIVMERLAIKVQVNVEAAVMARLLMLPAGFFKEYSGGNLANRAQSISLLCEQLMSVYLGTGLMSLLSLVYIFQIAAYAPQLALPSLLVVLLDSVATVVLVTVNARYDRDMMESNASLSGTVTALLTDISEIKLTGAEERAFGKWAKGYAQYARLRYNRPLILRTLPAIVMFINMMGTVVIYALASLSAMSVANFMSFNVAFGQVLGAMLELSNMSAQISSIRPTLELIEPILQEVPELAEDKPMYSIARGALEVSNLHFRYDESLPYVVQDLSFSIRAGEYVAIVGKSGCGKSTIMRLLLGFETPQRGSIFYDGKDLNDVDKRALRRSIGTVMQDGRLFLGNILSNITIATPQASLDDAWKAAELAGIADDIRMMPMGMQTMVTEGSGGLSGGQRQRLMIARAICGNRKILIFDEATSALDNVTQRHVSESLASLACTRIVIAHRLSTVLDCDRILLIDEGHIVEEGSYDELMELDGQFADLVRRQQVGNVI